MTTSTFHTTPEALRAVAAEMVAEMPRYPDGAVVLPASVEPAVLARLIAEHDPRHTVFVFVREDGAQLMIREALPRRLSFLLRRLGVRRLHVEVLSATSEPIYRHEQFALRDTDMLRVERHGFVATC